MKNTNNNLKILVIKREGKKVPFNGSKIAIAIKKGFDNANIDKENQYSEKDVYKVYNLVVNEIENRKIEKIKIEEIQDIIEAKLMEQGYEDVYKTFSSYRERRNQSRKIFFDEKKQHKFLKALEKLGLTTQQEEEIEKNNYRTAKDTMLKYGSTVSQEFAKAYLIKNKYIQAHESGEIYIHNIDFMPMGTTQNCNIDLQKLYEEGFWIGNQFIEEPQGIEEYAISASIALQANSQEQHGQQSIQLFDYYMSEGVLKTFKNEFKKIVYNFLEYSGFKNFIALNGISREIEKISSINLDITIFDSYTRDTEKIKQLFRLAYSKALEETNNLTYKAMKKFIQNININNPYGEKITSKLTIGLGTSTSAEGRMVIKNLLLLAETNENILPTIIFKIKNGINFKKTDKNYDLFKTACNIASKNGNINFAFIDAPQNMEYYNQYDYNTEVSYIGRGIRILENKVDANKSVTSGRGVLCTTTINLPRIGIRNGNISGNKCNMEKFYEELSEKLELAKEQLLERFEIQCSKKVSNFPFLIGQNIWIDSEKIKETNKFKKALKNGNLAIGFVGLAECLQALIGQNQLESEEAQKLGIEIIKFMKQKVDDFSEKLNLNFVLSATEENNIAQNFIAIDRAIYGKLPKINDKESYTKSFQVPQSSKNSIQNKIKIESPYHNITNGGHIFYLQADKVKDLEKVLIDIKENGIGYVHIQKIKKETAKVDK